MPVYEYKASSNKLNLVAGGTFYADAPIGSIQAYGGTTAPSGWLLCQGQAVSRAEYAELFKAIGTAFGSGDGSTTFNVPDLRESVPKGTGLTSNSNYHLNDNGGLNVGEFIDDRLQGHGHSIPNGFDGSSEGSAERGDGRHGNSIHSTLPQQYSADYGTPRIGSTTEVKAVGVNYIIKAKQSPVPADFMNAVDDTMNECKILPYELNRSSNVPAFNRKWLVTGNSIVWTATHTGRLTIRCLKHGDGYSLYLTNQNSVMLDSYDNFFGDTEHGLTVSEASITLQAWVRKGDVIELSTNLPSDTEWADKYFVQTGLLLYNDTFD